MHSNTHPAPRAFPWRAIGWSAAVALILLPFVAMQFTREVSWTLGDFVVFAAMVGSAGLAAEFLLRRGGGTAYRIAAGIAIFASFFLIWVNLAVGIIGSENNDANAMYAAVIAVEIGGTILAHARPAGMARTMFAAAGATVVIAIIAVVGDLGTDGKIWPRDVIGATAILATLWGFAGILFGRAAQSIQMAA